MKIKAQKGFSLAEVLISLTVVSIMLAVAAPVLTKHTVGDNAWKWSNGNEVKNGTSYDGNNVVIGPRTVPTVIDIDNGYFYSLDSTLRDRDSIISNATTSALSLDSNRMISKISILNETKGLESSHLSFYNVIGTETEYAGRLASNKDNLALGIGSLQKLDDGIRNTAIGHYALAYDTDGNDNVALGYGALAKNTTGSNNTAVGYRALLNGSNTSDNTVVGNYIGNAEETIGSNNLIIGNYDVSSTRTWGNNNIFIGNNAGKGMPTYIRVDVDESKVDVENIQFININADNVLAIGNVNLNGTSEEKVELMQSYTTNSGDNQLRKIVVNGDFVVRTANGEKTLFKVDASGETIDYNESRDASILKSFSVTGPDRCEGAAVCIGKFRIPYADCGFLSPKSNPIDAYDIYMPQMAVGVYHSSLDKIPYLGAALLYLDRYKDTKGALMALLDKRDAMFAEVFGVSSNGLNLGGFIEALFGLSDARLKNIYGDSTVGLKEINALKIKNYTYKADKIKTPHVGVIAQELQKIFPNSVIEGADGYLSIKQEEMFYGLVNSIQELSKKNDKVSEKIALSKEKVEYTNAQNKLIEQENKLLEKQNKEFAKRIAKLQKNK